VPIALGSMILALVLLARATISGRFDETGRLAATVTVAILANALVCGALSGPHDRYGARIAWIATFTAAIAILRAINNLLPNAKGKGAWLTLAPSPRLRTIENQIRTSDTAQPSALSSPQVAEAPRADSRQLRPAFISMPGAR